MQWTMMASRCAAFIRRGTDGAASHLRVGQELLLHLCIRCSLSKNCQLVYAPFSTQSCKTSPSCAAIDFFVLARHSASPSVSRALHRQAKSLALSSVGFPNDTSKMIDIVALLENLPSPLDRIASLVLLEHIPHVDTYLLGAAVLLLSLAFFQLHAFSRPPPVPLKRLPKRPTLHVLFKPDDISQQHRQERGAASRGAQQMASGGGGGAAGRAACGLASRRGRTG